MRAQSILDSPLNLQPRESEIVDTVFQSEKSIRRESVESCKLRYFTQELHPACFRPNVTLLHCVGNFHRINSPETDCR